MRQSYARPDAWFVIRGNISSCAGRSACREILSPKPITIPIQGNRSLCISIFPIIEANVFRNIRLKLTAYPDRCYCFPSVTLIARNKVCRNSQVNTLIILLTKISKIEAKSVGDFGKRKILSCSGNIVCRSQ